MEVSDSMNDKAAGAPPNPQPSYELHKAQSTANLVRRNGQAWVNENKVRLDREWEYAVSLGLPHTDEEFLRHEESMRSGQQLAAQPPD